MVFVINCLDNLDPEEYKDKFCDFNNWYNLCVADLVRTEEIL